jgi:ankyrin repeat protein
MMTARRVPIIDLVSIGAIDEVRDLIQAGCDVNEKDYCGECAVIRCVDRNDDDILAVLIEANANLDVKNIRGIPALELAKRLNHNKVAKLIEDSLNQKKASESSKNISESDVQAQQTNSRNNGYQGLHFHSKTSGKHIEELKEENQYKDPNDEMKETPTNK